MSKQIKFTEIVGFASGKNSRDAIKNLSKQGYCVFRSENFEDEIANSPLMDMVYGEKADDSSRKKYCKLIETNEEDLHGLCLNLKEIGQQHPSKLIKTEEPHKFLLYSGCRRLLAHCYNWIKAGCPEDGMVIKADVEELSEEDAEFHGGAINLHQKAMSRMETARYYNKLKTVRGWKIKEIAKFVGKAGKAGELDVSNHIRLLDLTPTQQRHLEEGKLTWSRALAILRGEDNNDPHAKPPGQRNRCLPFNKAKELYDNKEDLAKIAEEYNYPIEAIRFGMELVMQLKQGKDKPDTADTEDEPNKENE